MSRFGRYSSDDEEESPKRNVIYTVWRSIAQYLNRQSVPPYNIPETEVADTYLDYSGFQRKQTEQSGLDRMLNPWVVNPSQQTNPFKEQLPKTATEFAVYGQYRGQPIHGPADWHQWYPKWDRIGQQYMGPDPRLTEPKVTDQKTSIVCHLHHQHLSFLMEEGFRFMRLLGKGGFGQVWEVEQSSVEPGSYPKKTWTRRLACKISLHKFNFLSVKEAMTEVCREAEIYENLSHPNIVHRTEILNLMDSESGFLKPIHVLFFMEMMEGDLFDLLIPADDEPATKQLLNESQIKSGWTQSPEKFTHNWVKQIVSGLRYLHERNIAHMDLKPENILFSTHNQSYWTDNSSERAKWHEPSGPTFYTYKLTDFGLALRFPEGEPCTGRCTITYPYFASPEQSTGVPYDAKASDIFSLGYCIISSLAGDDFEFSNVRNAIQIYNPAIGRMYRISEACADLVKAMIDHDPQQRPDIVRVEQDDWLIESFQ